MKLRSAVPLLGLAFSFAVPVLGQQKDKIDPQIIEQLDTIIEKYTEAINNNDAAAVAALYTDDAVFVSDTGPVYGRQAIEKYYSNEFKGWRPKNHSAKRGQDGVHVLGTAGNETWDNGEWSETGQGEKGEPRQIHGFWSGIDTRDGDGWKIQMLTWNITPAPATTSAGQANTPDPQLRKIVEALTKKFADAWNSNDASVLAALFTKDAVLVSDSGPIYGRDAIENYYLELFRKIHFSNHFAQADQYCPHVIGMAGKEMWWNGQWTNTIKGQDFGPLEIKGYWTSIAALEDGDWKDRMQIFNVTPAK